MQSTLLTWRKMRISQLLTPRYHYSQDVPSKMYGMYVDKENSYINAKVMYVRNVCIGIANVVQYIIVRIATMGRFIVNIVLGEK